MIAGLEARLAALAAAGQTITYGALARELHVPGPGSIARLTGAIELLMAEDAAAGQPFRAAVCAGRLAGDMPGRGFFALAERLGRFDGRDASGFVAAERRALRVASR